jgi:hypothetical protein
MAGAALHVKIGNNLEVNALVFTDGEVQLSWGAYNEVDLDPLELSWIAWFLCEEILYEVAHYDATTPKLH